MSAATTPDIFKAYDIRGLYGEQIDGDIAERIGRAFARVLAGLAGKPTAELRVGLGRDMRLSAPELAARYREGLLAEGAHVLDAGQVGSEMLYYLVGSRGLDGGLMCTASHNPKAYTGAKLVREGAIALSGDTGIQDIRREVEAQIAGGDGERGDGQGRGSVEQVELYDEFQQAALRFIDADAVRSRPGKPLKVVLDGGNGMAGPMVGPLLDALGLDLVRDVLDARRRTSPTTSPTRCCPRTASSSSTRCARAARTSASPGTATPTAASSSTTAASSSTATSSPRCWPSRCCAKRADPRRPEAILYDVRASRAVADTVTAAGGTAHVNRVGHAFFKTRMREEGSLFGGEVSGHYYFRDFYCADSGTIPALLMLELLCREGRPLSELLERLPRALLHLRRDQLRGRRPAGQDARRSPQRYADARQERARRHLDRLRGLALQRAPVQHRAAAAAVPRVARLARGHGAPPRRGARADPLGPVERHVSAEPLARASRRGGDRGPAAGERRRGGHPPPRRAHAVHGRARQRLPDRGRRR